MNSNVAAINVANKLNVSRETLDRLECYVGLLLKWQKTINLIGTGTVESIWYRHILDCGQLMNFLPEGRYPIVDLGSGAGLPGMVLGILGVKNVKLIEANAKKCAFLREALRVTGTRVEVVECRIEVVKDLSAEVVIARALAPLAKLLELAKIVSKPTTTYLFLKGSGFKNELTDVKNNWKMEFHPSMTNPDGAIIQMESVNSVHTDSN